MPDASRPRDALSFQELMDYTGEETGRWEAWLRAHDDAVLDVPLGEGRWGTVRELLFHTFLVERRYADRLLGDPITPYEGVPHQTVDELFAIHRAARERLARYVAQATPEEWDEVLTFETLLYGPMHGSRRKVVAHALLHGVRHWAQIATALRQAGYEQWPHDLLAATTIA
ncbi:MAG: DinB family protein [Longimicrobiaceae bacterium]